MANFTVFYLIFGNFSRHLEKLSKGEKITFLMNDIYSISDQQSCSMTFGPLWQPNKFSKEKKMKSILIKIIAKPIDYSYHSETKILLPTGDFFT